MNLGNSKNAYFKIVVKNRKTFFNRLLDKSIKLKKKGKKYLISYNSFYTPSNLRNFSMKKI